MINANAYRPSARTYVDPAEQREANEFWSHYEIKKWVVLLSRGPASRREHREVFVSAKSQESAIKTGKAAASMMNRTWARGCAVSARLATYADLGCKRVTA